MRFPRNYVPRILIVFIDLLISMVALAVAYLVRFDLKADTALIAEEWSVLSKSILVILAVKWIVFQAFQIQKGIIRHTSTEDIKRIFLACLTATGLLLILGVARSQWVDGFYLMPMSVLLVELLTCILLMTTFRFGVKLLYSEMSKTKSVELSKVLIYGAGISGLVTKRAIEKDIQSTMEVVGFVDDNKRMTGTKLEGIKIYHTDEIARILHREGVHRLIVAIQNPKQSNVKRIADACLEANVEVQKVPSTKSWINGEFSTKQIAKVKIEDLLGRDAIDLDMQKIQSEINGKTVLVSGAAGSIGSEMVRQMAQFSPKLLILLDIAESPMYDFVNELRSNFPALQLEVVIGDIRHRERMRKLMETFKPQYVLHAAAYKHVPLMEDNPAEAVFTNIGGTRNLVDQSIAFGVDKFVMVSTDKAVNPTNVMGASKRIAEMYAQFSNSLGKTKFVTTRFGNVLGSNGSVIPLFQRQIEQGGPITVTDERITRFFMTIPEACQLVLEAGAMGEGGEIFVFDMGESVKIVDLAKKMIRLSGLELGKDIEIKFTGLRPGEKLYEELLSNEENTIPTHHSQILKAKIKPVEEQQIQQILELLEQVDSQDNIDLVGRMKKIVPEFKSNNSEFEKLDQ